MKIIAIRDVAAPIKSAIRNAYIDFGQMTASVVAIVTDRVADGARVIGYGFNSNGRYAAQGLLRERFIPRLSAAEPSALLDEKGLIDPLKCWAAMMRNEKPGGHGERSVAVGVLDMALWDARAKAEGLPLWTVVAERFNGGRADEACSVYAAGGYYYPGKGLADLREEIKSYRDLGYRAVKVKIGGASLADDLRRIEAVLDVVADGGDLAVDANGRFDLPAALDYANALADFGLRWFEEPLDPLDYAAHATLAERYPKPLATGENLFSMQDARNLVRHAGLRPDRDFLQFDPALSYGLVEYLRMIEMVESHGWSRRRFVPHGGHQFALNIAIGLGLGGNESYPLVFKPFGGFADDQPVVEGRIKPHQTAGIGFERKNDLYAVMKLVGEPPPRVTIAPGPPRVVAAGERAGSS